VVGRVCCDGNGRLNANSLVLEASLDSSSGCQAPLDVSNVPQFSLFPGQVTEIFRRLGCVSLLDSFSLFLFFFCIQLLLSLWLDDDYYYQIII